MSEPSPLDPAPFDIPQEILARYNHLGALGATDSPFSRPTDIGPDAYAGALWRASHGDSSSMSVYVHLPFCPVRCLSCSQNTTVTHRGSDIDHYLDDLDREMDLVVRSTGLGVHLRQLHVGGGTPNYLSDLQLVRLMSILERHFLIDEHTETSLEANPRNTSAAQLALLRGLGFYRINFGVRDLDLDVQQAIGRFQSREMLHDVFCMARDSGFETVNMDLTYGLPGQTGEGMEETVDKVIALAPDQILCCAFVLKPDFQPHQRTIDPRSVPSLAQKIGLFNRIVKGLTAARYTWVGVDSFAKDDDELAIAQAQHRLKRNWIGYSLDPAENLLGFGANAISEADGLCVQNHTNIDVWHDDVRSGNLPILGGFQLTETDRVRRNAMVELLCNLELRNYTPLLETRLARQSWSDLARNGLMVLSPDGVSITPRGRYFMTHAGADPMALGAWRDLQPQVG